jgi:hypothetical protein
MMKFHSDTLTVEYPVQTGCHGTVDMARRIFKVVMRPLSNQRIQIHVKGDKLPGGRTCQNTVIYADFYASQNQVEAAVRQHMQEKQNVAPENVTLRWEKGDLFYARKT